MQSPVCIPEPAQVASECIVHQHSWLHREQCNHLCEYQSLLRCSKWISGLARAFLGGQAAHPEDQNEEENEEKLKNESTGK